jgi:hypothetical protein
VGIAGVGAAGWGGAGCEVAPAAVCIKRVEKTAADSNPVVITRMQLLLWQARPLREQLSLPETGLSRPITVPEDKESAPGAGMVAAGDPGCHLELVPRSQAGTYIQHNPNINTGRAGFLEAFSRGNKPANPIPAQLKNPPPLAGVTSPRAAGIVTFKVSASAVTASRDRRGAEMPVRSSRSDPEVPGTLRSTPSIRVRSSRLSRCSRRRPPRTA